MARRQKEPLRALTTAERAALEQITRASSERADCVARATALLAVADGAAFAVAARAAGRRSGDAVARLVARFNREGLAAVTPGHGGGPARRYQAAEQGRILQEFHRQPLIDLIILRQQDAQAGGRRVRRLRFAFGKCKRARNASRVLAQRVQNGVQQFRLFDRLPQIQGHSQLPAAGAVLHSVSR